MNTSEPPVRNASPGPGASEQAYAQPPTRLVWAVVGLFLFIGVSSLPPFRGLMPEAWFVWVAYTSLGLLAAVAAFVQAGRTRRWPERRFWMAVGVGPLMFGLVQIGYTGILGGVLLEDSLVAEIPYLLGYSGFVAAILLPPDRRPALLASAAVNSLQAMATAVFMAAAFAYFAVIPFQVQQGVEAGFVPSLTLYVTLDFFVFLGFASLYTSATSERWRRVFRVLAIAALWWTVLDLWEGMSWLGSAPMPESDASLWYVFWYAPFVLYALAVAVPEAAGLSRADPNPTARVFPAVMVYPVLLAGAHLISELLGLIGEESSAPRQALVLIAMLILTTLGLAYQWSLQARAQRLADKQRRVEERLARSEKMEALGGMAGGIAHDFNNVLAAILGYGEVLRTDAPPGSAHREDIDGIIFAAERGKAMVAQILAFSEMREIERRPIRLAASVTEALQLVRKSLPENVTVRTVLDEGVRVQAEESQLLQVVVNLVGNAAHAMEESGGRLFIDVHDEPATTALPSGGAPTVTGWAVLSVSDEGHGIPAGVLERVFDPFFTTKDVGEGTGLGLAAVHRIVTAHGGSVDVDSTVGSGTTFTVRLPLLAAGTEGGRAVESPAVPASGAGGDATAGSSSGRILVVDDEEAVGLLISRNLKGLGFEVDTQVDPLQAWDRFKEAPERFDAIVTDQRMPGMTGLELAYNARELRPDLPVMLVTGFSDALNDTAVAEAGIYEVLGKPFRREDLTGAVSAMMASVSDDDE